MPDVAKHRARHEEARGLRRGSGAGRRAPSRRALWVSSLLSKKLKMSSSWLGAVWGTRSVLQALVVNGGNPRVVGAVLPPGRCSRGFSPFSIKGGAVPNPGCLLVALGVSWSVRPGRERGCNVVGNDASYCNRVERLGDRGIGRGAQELLRARGERAACHEDNAPGDLGVGFQCG